MEPTYANNNASNKYPVIRYNLRLNQKVKAILISVISIKLNVTVRAARYEMLCKSIDFFTMSIPNSYRALLRMKVYGEE